MNRFDLAEEMAIANMINALKNSQITGLLSNNQISEIIGTISNHVYESNLKMKSPINNNIEATPTMEQRAKLTPVSDAARLWGEEPEEEHHHYL